MDVLELFKVSNSLSFGWGAETLNGPISLTRGLSGFCEFSGDRWETGFQVSVGVHTCWNLSYEYEHASARSARAYEAKRRARRARCFAHTRRGKLSMCMNACMRARAAREPMKQSAEPAGRGALRTPEGASCLCAHPKGRVIRGA